jgi:hypothetical protein
VLDSLASALAEGFMTPQEMHEALQAVDLPPLRRTALPALPPLRQSPLSPEETARVARIFQGEATHPQQQHQQTLPQQEQRRAAGSPMEDEVPEEIVEGDIHVTAWQRPVYTSNLCKFWQLL